MKNAFIALTFVLVATTAFGALDASTKAKLQKITSTTFGKTIMETIQVELQSKADPRPKILSLLEDLERELIDQQQTADDDFKALSLKNSMLIGSIQGELNGLGNKIAEESNLAQSLNNQISSTQQQLDGLNSLIDSLSKQLEDLTANRASGQETFEHASAKLAHVIEVLNQVRAVITSRLAARGAEFLQVSKKELHQNFVEIKKHIESSKFKKAAPGFAKMISFIASKVEAHIKNPSDDEEAGNLLTSVVTLIDNLVGAIQSELTLLTENNQNAADDYNRASQDINNQLTEKTQERDLQSTTLTDLKGQLAQVEADLQTDNARVVDLNGQLQSEDSSFQQLTNAYQKTTHDRNDNLALIQQVHELVQTKLTGLRQYAEDYLANH